MTSAFTSLMLVVIFFLLFVCTVGMLACAVLALSEFEDNIK
jgi:hypothetical protein